MHVLLNALHHGVERLEVVRVQRQVRVHVVAHLHHGLAVQGLVHFSTSGPQVVRGAEGLVLENCSQLAGLLLDGEGGLGCVEGVRNLCHLI